MSAMTGAARTREISPRTDRLPVGRFPRIGLIGIVLIGIGLVEEFVGSLASPALVANHASGHDVHLVAFLGMVFVLVGVLRAASAVGAARTQSHTEQEVSDAVR